MVSHHFQFSARCKTLWLILIHDKIFSTPGNCCLQLLSHVHIFTRCVIVKIRDWAMWPGGVCTFDTGKSHPFKSMAAQGETSWEAWRRAIITEWGRNANQPAMRWVCVGWDAHAYHTGLWKTTPPEAPTASFHCGSCSRHCLNSCKTHSSKVGCDSLECLCLVKICLLALLRYFLRTTTKWCVFLLKGSTFPSNWFECLAATVKV